ncbi:hypothetical protein DR_0931 [Deinococcus radiodurans R1 = ATCC 13939 = DSM 20539]|uniref:Uncharacterized protein n=1 Tax=Deinococcus radiodurans (strain ATCC 13939 / DSM 20539 / JCM 16871 / CCUG 27074 / LMG 4051 / NBRC 15346 / NCIMB 9279 / VKM B-1422 / R1) TaxID=243230 RepID=Q9RVU1_DEIRA|nr:hypothetical protein DR_0931 [Deinococcus radiodurans R1 = ATCC 13939 = DSM 20539]
MLLKLSGRSVQRARSGACHRRARLRGAPRAAAHDAQGFVGALAVGVTGDDQGQAVLDALAEALGLLGGHAHAAQQPHVVAVVTAGERAEQQAHAGGPDGHEDHRHQGAVAVDAGVGNQAQQHPHGDHHGNADQGAVERALDGRARAARRAGFGADAGGLRDVVFGHHVGQGKTETLALETSRLQGVKRLPGLCGIGKKGNDAFHTCFLACHECPVRGTGRQRPKVPFALLS